MARRIQSLRTFRRGRLSAEGSQWDLLGRSCVGVERRLQEQPLRFCCSLLAAACWLLAAGCWLKAASCWLTAAGCFAVPELALNEGCTNSPRDLWGLSGGIPRWSGGGPWDPWASLGISRASLKYTERFLRLPKNPFKRKNSRESRAPGA